MAKLIPFLRCNVLMDNSKKQDLTGQAELSWARCVISPADIQAVRESVDDDYEGLAVVHFRHNEYFITDIKYDELVTWWTGGTIGDKFIEDFNNIFGQ